MKKDGSQKRTRAKALGIAVAAFAVGIGLMVLSRMFFESARQATAAASTQPAATSPSPASAPANAPAESPGTPLRRSDPKAAAAQRMGGLTLLFSLMFFGLGITCVGWVIYDIRRSRPAWITQTKYPVMEKKHKHAKK